MQQLKRMGVGGEDIESIIGTQQQKNCFKPVLPKVNPKPIIGN